MESWTTGGDSSLSHIRIIGNYEAGRVHEVFARKLFSLTYGETVAVRNEICAMANLCNGNHKNLVRVLGCGEFADLSYSFIDMELCELNLDDFNKSRWVVAKVDGGPTDSQIWSVMMEISSGLSYIHDNTAIHGDLKPSNGRYPFAMKVTVVLYYHKDKAWKLTGFGITTPLTATESVNQIARATTGYRAPELLLQHPYTNSVDIWALGCILHELNTSEKRFLTDAAVLEYCQSPVPLTVRRSDNIATRSIASAISDMLQVDSSLRPSAAQLSASFSRYYQLCQKTEPLTVSPPTPRLPLEADVDDWSPKLSWISPPKSDSPPTVFRVCGERPGTDWLVLHVVVNKPNNRIVLVSCDDNQENFSVKLCNTSGTVLWQKTDVMASAQELVLPAFTEDGKYLAVYIEENAETINAVNGTSVNIVSIRHLKPTALAIARNGKDLAISTPDKLSPDQPDGVILSKASVSGADGNKQSIAVLTFTLDNPRIIYLAKGRRLFAIGHRGDQWASAYDGFFFDATARTLIKSCGIGRGAGANGVWGASVLDAPIYHITKDNEPCCIFRTKHLGGDVQASFASFTSEGRCAATCDSSRLVNTISAESVLGLDAENQIWSWIPGDWSKVATIEGEDLPSLLELKAITVSESQITLILDDERFIFLKRG